MATWTDLPDSPITCLPHWHTAIARISDMVVRSGCSVNSSGNVPCTPATMAGQASASVSSVVGPISVDAYSLGRYVTSEVGSGTPEEMMGVALAGLAQAKKSNQTITGLLTNRSVTPAINKGYYGPIHVDVNGVRTSPYGRWAATSQDPTLRALAVANLALSGMVGDFVRGADDQNGPDSTDKNSNPLDWPQVTAKQNQYWIGPVAGINPWVTMLVKTSPEISPTSAQGLDLIQEGKNALSRSSHDWAVHSTVMPVCPASSDGVTSSFPARADRGGPIAAAVSIVASLGIGLVVGKYVTARSKLGR